MARAAAAVPGLALGLAFGLMLGLMLGSAAPAEAQPGGEPDARSPATFDRASQALLDGDPQRAAELFERAANQDDDPRAADALFSAARLYQTRLGNPRRALALYRQLVERFPAARAAAAAQLRADDLANELDDAPDASTRVSELDAAIARAARGQASEAAQTIAELAAENPDWPGTARALDWLGAHYRAAGRLDEARDAYRALSQRFPGSPRAGPATAAADALDRQLDRERRLGWLDAGAATAALLGLLALLVWIRAAAGSWRSTPRRLAIVPGEVLFAVPIALALSLAAWAVGRDVGQAVASVCGAGVIATWLVAASASRATPGAVLGRLVAAVATVAGTAVWALHRTGILDRIVDSAAG